MTQEILDIINENDEVIGQATREEVHKKGLLHRQIHILVVNNQKHVLIHQRSFKKDNYPGLWDVVIGGHVETGEDYLKTAQREFVEELGANFVPESLVFLSKQVHEHSDKISGAKIRALSNHFAYRADNGEFLNFDKNEIEKLEWVDLEELLDMIKNNKGDFVFPVYKYGGKFLEEYKNKILKNITL